MEQSWGSWVRCKYFYRSLTQLLNVVARMSGRQPSIMAAWEVKWNCCLSPHFNHRRLRWSLRCSSAFPLLFHWQMLGSFEWWIIACRLLLWSPLARFFGPLAQSCLGLLDWCLRELASKLNFSAKKIVHTISSFGFSLSSIRIFGLSNWYPTSTVDTQKNQSSEHRHASTPTSSKQASWLEPEKIDHRLQKQTYSNIKRYLLKYKTSPMAKGLGRFSALSSKNMTVQ